MRVSIIGVLLSSSFLFPTLFKTPSLPVDMSTAELAVSYAALILADDGIEVSVRIPNSVEIGGFVEA